MGEETHHLQAAEQAVVGAAICRPQVLGEIEPALAGHHFYETTLGRVWDVLTAMAEGGTPIDVVTAEAACVAAGITLPPDELTALAMSAPFVATASVNRYAAIVADGARRRQLGAVAAELGQAARSPDGDTDEMAATAETQLAALADDPARPATTALRDELDRMLERMMAQRDGERAGLPTGLGDLDRALEGGLRPSQLVVVGARPGMGKTALAIGIAGHVAIKEQRPVLFASLEMPARDIATRLAAQAAQLDLSRMMNAQRLASDELTSALAATERIHAAPLRFVDTTSLTVGRLASEARRMARGDGLGLVVVDYLQLMDGRGNAENRQVAVAEISRALKSLAMELDVPVLALSQLSRQLEQRPNKRPQLSDLRESGNIEQDADIVLFLYRDEEYNPDTTDKGLAELSVAKHRNGATGTLKFAWLAAQARIAQQRRETDDV